MFLIESIELVENLTSLAAEAQNAATPGSAESRLGKRFLLSSFLTLSTPSILALRDDKIINHK